MYSLKKLELLLFQMKGNSNLLLHNILFDLDAYILKYIVLHLCICTTVCNFYFIKLSIDDSSFINAFNLSWKYEKDISLFRAEFTFCIFVLTFEFSETNWYFGK